MSKWRTIDTVYLYDGTIEGLFTIAYECLKFKTKPKEIWREDNYEPNLLDETIFIETDIKKAEKIKLLIDKISNKLTYNIYKAHFSCEKDKAIPILHYILLSFKYGKSLDFRKDMDCVIYVNKIGLRVSYEAHRMEEFIRFRELSNGILYSEIEPDNNVLQLISNHFRKRYMIIPWIINDLGRNIAIIYDTKNITIIDSSNLNINNLVDCDDEKSYQDMWKMFFKNIAIKERTNKRCQANFMPRRYWKHMLEVEGDN